LLEAKHCQSSDNRRSTSMLKILPFYCI